MIGTGDVVTRKVLFGGEEFVEGLEPRRHAPEYAECVRDQFRD